MAPIHQMARLRSAVTSRPGVCSFTVSASGTIPGYGYAYGLRGVYRVQLDFGPGYKARTEVVSAVVVQCFTCILSLRALNPRT